MKTKYVVGEVMLSGGAVMMAVAFPEFVQHKTMAERVFIKDTVRSAGFFTVEEREGHSLRVQTYGDSVSLGLKPMDNDHILIARSIGVHPDCY